ncbi:sulfite exporter TauE/SafE family protein [Metabacillus herbersteinensis]|uniref:Sulfite exporter TauE/SafE family protein n=1 Tax=Metabacillus herbersteinensis TaxID=283816 RepID=A0ABV6GM92_9BACI
MYELFSQFSNILMQPFLNIYYEIESISLIAALVLGLVGALAPCQLTANGSALMIYGNNSMRRGVSWQHIFLFMLGKIVVFSLLGFIVWLVGSGIEQKLTVIFPWSRRLIGPLLIIVGVFLLNIIKIKGDFSLGKIPSKFFKGKLGSFLMGVSFSLGFCPTMFVLFFVTLIPLTLSEPYGFILPSIFTIGTTIPILFIMFIIWFLEIDKKIMKKSRKVGLIVQRVAGVFLIILGVLDTVVYL